MLKNKQVFLTTLDEFSQPLKKEVLKASQKSMNANITVATKRQLLISVNEATLRDLDILKDIDNYFDS